MSKKNTIHPDAAAVMPLPPTAMLQRAKDGCYEPTGAYSNNTDLPADCDVFVLGQSESKDIIKLLRNSKQKLCVALNAYLGLAAAVPNPGVGWLLLALCLMSVVLDAICQILPGLIAIEITGSTVPSRFIGTLLDVHTIFPQLSSGKKEKYKIKQPTIMKGIGGKTTAMDLLGGTADSFWGKIRLWLPIVNRPAVILPSVPEGVQREVLARSPFALPICLGGKCPVKGSTVIKLKAADTDLFDKERLTVADGNLDFIHAILAVFSDWVHRKKAPRRKIMDTVDSFIPIARNGRFCRDLRADPQVMVRATALTVLKVFLGFCCDEGWLTVETAEDYLATAWMSILPESCPTPPVNGQPVSAIVAWDKQEFFWTFLQQYLGDGSKVLFDCKGDADTVALVNNIAGEKYLVLPRKAFCDAYRDYITAAGGALPEGNFATTLQGTMVDTWGIHLRHEGNDAGYRYTFYIRTALPVNAHVKLHCLTIPWAQIPEEIRLQKQPDQTSQRVGETHA